MNDFDPSASGDVSLDDRNIAVLTHLSGIILCFIVPLIVWLIHRDKPGRDFLNDQAKEALNFQLTLLLGYIVGTVLTVILIGALINLVVWVAGVIFSIVAALAVQKGERYRYPFAFRLMQ